MDPILISGFKLLLVGMGMVTAFLGVMVVLVNLSAKLLAPFKNMFETPTAPVVKPAKTTSSNLMQDEKLVKVLGAAIKTFQQDK